MTLGAHMRPYSYMYCAPHSGRGVTRSAKRKVPAAPESSHAAQGKVPKLGESSSPSSIREQGLPRQFWARGCTPHPVAEVSEVTGP